MTELKRSPSGAPVDVAAGGGTTDDVLNVSTVDGTTATDALNELKAPSVVTYTASRVAQLSDAGKWVRMNVGAGNTYTIPTNAAVPFPIGTLLTVEQAGAGVTQIVNGGVTLNKPASYAVALNLAERYAVVTAKKVDVDEWTLSGGFFLA